ncbi:helix-turn-helix domain-containing protein [Streptomyces sp. NPDC005476]|uniref:helix-turn-helix domain-containing protein n=1 Tax=Streptomyces sp. NPDC005476 TaxID=3156882 RepID=UPI003455FF4E
MVLHAARGLPNARIVKRVGVHVDTVRTWRSRFAELGIPGPRRPQAHGTPALLHPTTGRSGQAPHLPTARRDRHAAVPLDNARTGPRAVLRGIVPFLSASTVRRWLAQDALKPWRHRSWIFITDLHFRTKPRASWICTPAPGTATARPAHRQLPEEASVALAT